VSRSRREAPNESNRRTRALLEFLDDPDYRPIPERELLHRLQLSKSERPAVRRLLRQLIDDGTVRRIRGGRLIAIPAQTEVRGPLERHRSGYAKVVSASGEEVCVAARHLADARPGDRVAVRVVARGRDGRLRGVVARVLTSERRELWGVFRQLARGAVIQPFDPVLGHGIHVPAGMHGKAADMHAVRFEIVRGPAGRTAREAKVLESLGHLDDPGTDTLVVVRKYGLATEFTADVLRAAAALPEAITGRDAAGRERFEDPAPVTIDGETARDFDDAIAVQELPRGGYRLFVHIADVAHFVEAGATLDAEARRRGTSVYFPDRVLPMFPEKLSTDLCSLRPGEDRLVQSVILDLTARGKVRHVRFADGVIRSAARLTYTQVAAVLEGKRRVRGVPAKLVPMLRAADHLRSVLERGRHRRGSIDFDLPEPQILLDVEGAMTGITIEPRNRAHLMIEEFMLLANETVAGYLEQQPSECLYRVHEPPEPDKLEALASFAKGFALELTTTGARVEPAAIQSLLEAVEGKPEGRVIAQVALHAMQQARYSVSNTGHFGLAAPVYCHFTSPIRRYPDLVVHRQLRRSRRGETQREAAAAETLRATAESGSERERRAESAERELLTWKKVAFIEGKQGDTFDGIVTNVTRFGLFVQLVDNLVEGLVRVELLGSEWFEFDAGRFELRGAESGTAFRLGDRLRVRVDRVDRVLRRVDLSPVGSAPQRRRGRRPRGGAKSRGEP
jgi:ribonuclease R